MKVCGHNNQVADRATGIIMNVKTGEILAMAVSGDYDPNNPFAISDPTVQAQIDAITDEEKKSKALGDARTAQWRNKAISDTYYPGSVFKMVTLSMALEENLVNENTTFTCTTVFHSKGKSRFTVGNGLAMAYKILWNQPVIPATRFLSIWGNCWERKPLSNILRPLVLVKKLALTCQVKPAVFIKMQTP